MFEDVQRYPLTWPITTTRTQPHKRVRGAFRSHKEALSIAAAFDRLDKQIAALGGSRSLLSSNVEPTIHGRPRSSTAEPRDPGVALYFEFRGKAKVFACDRYFRVADNIAAIAGHVDALRRIERYGVGSLDQALEGYKSLPADTAANWRNVFGFQPDSMVTVELLETAYHDRARKAHPDKGGSEDAMSHINRARDFARRELAS